MYQRFQQHKWEKSLWVGNCSYQVFKEFIDAQTVSAPIFTHKVQRRKRKTGKHDQIISYGWYLKASPIMPPLDDTAWYTKNYEPKPGERYKLKCTRVRFVYFALTQNLRADISYKACRYNMFTEEWDCKIFEC